MSLVTDEKDPLVCLSPLCGYLEIHSVCGREAQHRCLHGLAVRERLACAWHRTPQQIAIISAQADQIVSAARQPFEPRKRGL